MEELSGEMIIGWTWARACSMLDKGEDPRKYHMPNLIDDFERDFMTKMQSSGVQHTVRQTLKNGARIICYKEGRYSTGAIVLAEGDHGGFVTWLMDNDGNTFLGNYFDTYKEAMDDFLTR